MRLRVSSSESQTKMKVLLFVAGLLVSGVVGEAPYPPSGWKPSGPAFEIPPRPSSLDPRNQRPIKQQEYLPPTQPRPSQGYGAPDVDLSVQGLPTVEQQPIFQLSPVNGLQYVGPQFNNDLRNLDQGFKQSQFQNQQQVYRQFARQKQLEASQLNGENMQPTPHIPRQLIPRTTSKPTLISTTERPTSETTTDLSLNEGEVANNDQNKNAKASVDVERQNLQQFPAELFLSPIAQLSQSQSAAQFGQLRGPIMIGPFQPEVSQRQVAGYDAQTHFAALPSVLAQQKLFQSQAQISQAQEIKGVQYPVQQYAPQIQYQVQPQVIAAQQQGQAFQDPSLFGQQQDTSFIVQGAQQPTTNQYTPQVQAFPQLQAQPVILQMQSSPAQELGNDGEDTAQPQLVYQYQLGSYQPRGALPTQDVMQTYQPQVQLQYQPEGQLQYQPQAPILPNQFYQQQYYQTQIPQQQIYQGQEGSLQSGFDVNQQGNGIDDSGKDERDDEYQDNNDNDDDGTAVTAVATAFGSRTEPRPRVSSRYGAPASGAEMDLNRSQTTTEATQEETTENGAAIAQATAISRGSRRKSAKLRSRRPRPLFTLDQSGHLVLAQDQ